MGKGLLGKAAIGFMAVIFAASSAFGYSQGVANASEAQPPAPVSSSAPMALTSAPPPEPLGTFNPNHQYLDSGTSSLSATTGTVTVSASTSANQAVDSIGITFYVQKWNGTTWETVGSGSTTGGNASQYYSNTYSKSVTAGYYYRARTLHWVIENGVYEEGEKFSNTVLGK